MKYPTHVFMNWLPLALTITCVSGLIYVAVQQSIRMGANDPQIQLAHDAAAALANGSTPESVTAALTPIDMTTSLAPYLLVFDDSSALTASTATLRGSAPVLPSGVFAYTRLHADDRITWEPAPSVRQAIVMVYHGGTHPGFVLAGRSLKEIENREANLLSVVTAACLITLLATLLITSITTVQSRRRQG